jgi:hypothetical protein
MPVDNTPEVAQLMWMDVDGPEGGVMPTPQGRVAPQNEPEATPPLLESKIPKGDRPVVPTFKENPKGVAIPGKDEARASCCGTKSFETARLSANCKKPVGYRNVISASEEHSVTKSHHRHSVSALQDAQHFAPWCYKYCWGEVVELMLKKAVHTL